MSWISSLFASETLPVLEGSMGFAHARHKAIQNNIANVENPYYKRQDVPEADFRVAMERAIERREIGRHDRFDVYGRGTHLRFSDNYPVVRRGRGLDWGPERHDENTVVIEKEMADLAKNTLYMETLQRLFKKKTDQMTAAASERVM